MSEVIDSVPRYEYPRSSAFKQGLTIWLIRKGLPALFSFLRGLPFVRYPKFIVVTRFDDVQEIFSRNDDFQVPYKAKVEHLSWKPNYLLGMDRWDEEYDATLERTMALWNQDDLAMVAGICETATRAELDHGQGNIDGMQRLMINVIVEVIEQYYGVAVPMERRREMTQASLQICGFLFASAEPSAAGIEEAKKAIAPLWEILDASIGPAYDGANVKPDTVLARAVQKHQAGEEGFDKAHVRSAMMGMIMGFLPTNTNANGRIFDVVMQRPDVRKQAIAAAKRDDADADEALLNVLFESAQAVLYHSYDVAQGST